MFIQDLFTNPISFFNIIVIFIASLCLHELAHGWAALNQGDDTPRRTGHMTLNPVVHMGWESIFILCLAGFAWGTMPVNPSKFRHRRMGNILVSAAGPLSNLALAILFMFILKWNTSLFEETISKSDFFLTAAEINLILFIFNLLPIPPLDGFHVFSEFFPSLKIFDNYVFELFALTYLFVTPFSIGVKALAEVIIRIFIPSIPSLNS